MLCYPRPLQGWVFISIMSSNTLIGLWCACVCVCSSCVGSVYADSSNQEKDGNTTENDLGNIPMIKSPKARNATISVKMVKMCLCIGLFFGGCAITSYFSSTY